MRDLPWEPNTVAILADFRGEGGTGHPACPRSTLRRVIERASALGFSAKFSCEFEFFLFEETPRSLHEKGFKKLQSLTPGMFGYSWVREGQNKNLMAAILDEMAAFDIEIEGLHTETGPGVYEVAIRYDDVLRAADKAALFKVAMKQIAHEHGLLGDLHGEVERRPPRLERPPPPEPLARRRERVRGPESSLHGDQPDDAPLHRAARSRC